MCGHTTGRDRGSWRFSVSRLVGFLDGSCIPRTMGRGQFGGPAVGAASTLGAPR